MNWEDILRGVGSEGDGLPDFTISNEKKDETGKVVGLVSVFLIGGVLGFLANEATRSRKRA